MAPAIKKAGIRQVRTCSRAYSCSIKKDSLMVQKQQDGQMEQNRPTKKRIQSSTTSAIPSKKSSPNKITIF
jgi:hypothetical protein